MGGFLKINRLLILTLTVIFVIGGFIFNLSQVEARRGCCSHHKGVCGCRCCDGTPLSAKCAPYYPQCNNRSVPQYVKEYTAEVPKENSDGGSIWWWLIGIGVLSYILYNAWKNKTS